MHCKEIQEQFTECVAGTLKTPAHLLHHMNGCVRCRTEFEEVRSLWAELGDISVPASDSSAVRQAVHAALSALKTEAITDRRNEMRPTLTAIFVIVLAATLAAGAGLLLHREPEVLISETPVAVPKPDARPAALNVRGLASAPFTLVEYGDYECPPCAVSHRIVKELLEKYPDRVQYEFRPFPLTGIHPNAMRAAVAAQAAGDQGKYWEMHDLLFESKKGASEDKAALIEMAKYIGLDADQFTRSMDLPEPEQRIQKAMAAARAAGVERVPTYFLNGKKVEGFPMTLQGFLGLMKREQAR